MEILENELPWKMKYPFLVYKCFEKILVLAGVGRVNMTP